MAQSTILPFKEKESVKQPAPQPEPPTFTYEQALEESKKYFNGEELPAKVFLDKYAMKNKAGQICEATPEAMHLRLATEFCRIERKLSTEKSKMNGTLKKMSQYGQERSFLDHPKILSLLKDFKYIVPQGSVMSLLGNKFQIGSLSNCIVLPKITDSYGGILYADQQLVQFMKRRCGVGLDLSTLRPDGSSVTNAAGTSTGPVSFMERFSNTTREVAQSGRRGALMITCFGPKTFVLTENGWENIVKVINDVREGQNKKAWTEEGFKKITDTQVIEDRELFEVELEDGKKIEVTADHKFVVKNNKGEEYLRALRDIDVLNEEIVIYE